MGNDANEHRRRAEEHLRRADQHPRSAQRWNRIALWGSGCVLVLYGIAGLLLLAAVVMVVLALRG
jgi:Flp pilus assembly protein TadB